MPFPSVLAASVGKILTWDPPPCGLGRIPGGGNMWFQRTCSLAECLAPGSSGMLLITAEYQIEPCGSLESKEGGGVYGSTSVCRHGGLSVINGSPGLMSQGT